MLVITILCVIKGPCRQKQESVVHHEPRPPTEPRSSDVQTEMQIRPPLPPRLYIQQGGEEEEEAVQE